jgi:hypothetical protein
MSGKLSASYEKVVLVLALVIALGLGAMVYLKAGRVETDFPVVQGSRKSVPKMELEEEFQAVAAKVGAPVPLPQPVLKNGRAVNLFVGIPWFLRSDSSEPVDLGDQSNAPVHPPIPNSWWLENGISPGYADSPTRDQDDDGFTNLEEFDAKTNPSDSTSHPSLVAKVECAKLIEKPFKIEYTSDTAAGPLTADTTYRFRFTDVVQGRRRTINSEFIKAGAGAASTFFTEGAAQLRFELKAVEQRQVQNPRNQLVETLNFAKLEDLSPAKKGDIHEVQKGSTNGKIITDYTAQLFLNAIGETGNVVDVPERTRFSLPLDPNAPDAERKYLFKEVTQDGEVVIEWKEGNEVRTRIITPNG